MLDQQQFGIVGTTFRRGGQDALNCYRLSPHDPHFMEVRASLHRELGLKESVYLNTCNRVELFFILPEGHSVAQCRRAFHAFFRARADVQASMLRPEKALHAYAGESAVERLFVIASALDSMVPGEAQVLGQLKEAMAQAQSAEHAGPQLSRLFAAAYGIAKRVRTDTALGAGVVSMASVAVHKGRAHLSALSASPTRTVAVIGTGEMARQAALSFRFDADSRLLFVSRDPARARALAAPDASDVMALDEFLRAPPEIDLVFTATGSAVPLLGPSFFAALSQASAARLLVIDLNVTRDCDPAAASLAQIRYLDIDALEAHAQSNRQLRQAEMGRARLLVDDALVAMRKRNVDREMAPVARALREAFSANVARSLGELQAGLEEPMPEQTQKQMALFAQTLVGRLAHVPTIGLKRIGYLHGVGAVDTFLTALDERREKNHE